MFDLAAWVVQGAYRRNRKRPGRMKHGELCAHSPTDLHRTLMRLPDPDQGDFYARLTLSGRWSSRELERQIGSMLYERAALSRRSDQLSVDLPAKGDALAPYDATFRDP